MDPGTSRRRPKVQRPVRKLDTGSLLARSGGFSQRPARLAIFGRCATCRETWLSNVRIFRSNRAVSSGRGRLEGWMGWRGRIEHSDILPPSG
jgi:hypothetical protein